MNRLVSRTEDEYGNWMSIEIDEGDLHIGNCYRTPSGLLIRWGTDEAFYAKAALNAYDPVYVARKSYDRAMEVIFND